MAEKSGNTYRFIGFHSFLIGLFPFYIPVYLWKMGISLANIAFFIALTGVGFCLTLWIWDRLHKQISLKAIITLSFLLEAVLLGMIFGGHSPGFLPLFALLNGAYNCLFWTTQRALFIDIIQPTNSGKKFGNLQIIVAVLLKSGIFIGGLMLDKFGFTSVFLFSLLVSSLAIGSYLSGENVLYLSPQLLNLRPIALPDILKFKDSFKSKPVFILDGLFLFLESYFWMISMFLIVKESFWELGILVVGLMLIFTILFLAIKNSIDRLPATAFYKLAVLLYALSWLMRGLITENLNFTGMVALLVFITFSTSLFRLSFNKRFFDLAKSTTTYRYLILKSYYSQASIAVLFGLIGTLLMRFNNEVIVLGKLYLVATITALAYAIYGKKEQRKKRDVHKYINNL